jgi:hypothetical protein
MSKTLKNNNKARSIDVVEIGIYEKRKSWKILFANYK